jgi:hypothetical protein
MPLPGTLLRLYETSINALAYEQHSALTYEQPSRLQMIPHVMGKQKFVINSITTERKHAPRERRLGAKAGNLMGGKG